MKKQLFQAPIDLSRHTSLIYAEGVFGLEARKKWSMRAKTADGILRYAPYAIAGIVDSSSNEKIAGEVLPMYLMGCKNFSAPIFKSIKEAKAALDSSALILGAAPEGGELPTPWRKDIAWALKNRMHVVSGLHCPLRSDRGLNREAARRKVTIWDARKTFDTCNISLGAVRAYAVKKPIVLTAGTDAAIGKMTVSYEMHQAAKKLGFKSALIPTGQTAIMIEGWGVAIDALPADFMTGAVEMMVCEKAKDHDILFVEGQGSLFHPAFANTTISLIHGAVPTHMVLVHKPKRRHSIGSRLIKLPSIKDAIRQYENAVLPSYRGAKVAGVALNADGLSPNELARHKKEIQRECGLPVFDAIKDPDIVTRLVKDIL